MRKPLVFCAWWTLVICGCPTRTIYYDAGPGDAGGQAGARGNSGAAGLAGHSSGGQGGQVGGGGSGGAAGGGSGGPGGGAGRPAGANGHGGAGALGGGGIAGHGAGGEAASGGIGGAAGAPMAGAGGDPYIAGYVVCGSVAGCPLANSGKCCYAQMDQSSACQAAAASCEAVMSGTTYYGKTTIQCDSSSDCAVGEICCYTEIYIGRSTACAVPSACVDAPPPGPGGYATYRRQVCDPNVVAPTECLSGSCKVATGFSQALPSYLYLCL